MTQRYRGATLLDQRQVQVALERAGGIIKANDQQDDAVLILISHIDERCRAGQRAKEVRRLLVLLEGKHKIVIMRDGRKCWLIATPDAFAAYMREHPEEAPAESSPTPPGLGDKITYAKNFCLDAETGAIIDNVTEQLRDQGSNTVTHSALRHLVVTAAKDDRQEIIDALVARVIRYLVQCGTIAKASNSGRNAAFKILLPTATKQEPEIQPVELTVDQKVVRLLWIKSRHWWARWPT